MKLSIITPVYNERKRIEEYLKRLEKQTAQPEIVLVDGGSTDGTVELIKQYQKKMPNLTLYFETGKYRSPANARNIGLEKAKGEFVVVFDVDTVFEKNFSKKIIQFISLNPKARVFRFNRIPLKMSNFESIIQKAYYYRDISRWISKYHYVFFIRKEVIPKFDSSLGYGEDKIWSKRGYKRLGEEIKKYGFVDSHKTLKFFVLGPSSLSEVWKRYKWYGRTGMLYYKKSHDKIHLLKMLLAFFSIPFIPLVLVPMARGFIYSLRVIKKYPQGIILIPLLESLAFPAMAIGIWKYLLGKNKKYRGH